MPCTIEFAELRRPIQLGLEELVNWNHPILIEFNQVCCLKTRLLSGWRKNQGYKFLFDREAIPDLLSSVPASDWRAYEETLRFFLEPNGVFPSHIVPRDPCGNLHWHCFMPKDAEQVCVVNRFAWLPGMALAARRSNHPAAVNAVFTVIDDWTRNCPFPQDVMEFPKNVWSHWYRPWAPLTLP